MHYSYSPIDRLDHLRADNDAISAFWQQQSTQIIVFWRNRVLIEQKGQQTPTLHPLKRNNLSGAGRYQTLLGTIGTTCWFSIELESDTEPDLVSLLQGSDTDPAICSFAELRVIGPHLPPDDGGLAIYARALGNWQNRSGFCPVCGQPAELVNAGHVRQCSNGDCGTQIFPRTDPAVIMLVTDSLDSNRCLLGRSKGWPDGVYSTLAGFVEAGESLEAAVAREVHEETGITVEEIGYVASQPWPFPQSIMLGFNAVATSSEIKINESELDDARWFSREELTAFGEWGETSDRFKLPRRDSIARYLIEYWLNKAPG